MDPRDTKTNDLERRMSTRNSVRISIGGGDDDFDVLAGMMVSDGFRPALSGMGTEPTAPPSSSATPAPAANSTESSANAAPPRPSSVSKPPRPNESLSLRHDGGMGPIEEASSVLTRTSSRSTDTDSTTTYVAAAESPYRGPSGPSHPYELYPQNVRMARTLSMTTASTEPVSEPSYHGPRTPAHPYGLYTQDTIAEVNSTPPAPIPIGFHGRSDPYQRRVGPEGEEVADIIGPDGHTEQLPPYTRYPDEAYARKVRDLEASPAAPATIGGAIVTVAAPLQTTGLQAIPGAGGIGLATRNPEFESMDDLGSPRSRHSSRSFTSDSSQHEINMAAAAYSEKPKPEKEWQSRMKRRVCGIIPLWSILLTLAVLLLMGMILGSVIGAFMSKQKKDQGKGHQEPSNSSPSGTFGVVPIPTPMDLPPLPLGTFSMPLMTSRVLSACFADTTLAQAWQCHLVISGLRLTIAKTKENSPGDYTATVTCNTTNTVANHVYSYGEQPFLIEKPATLELVNDTYDPGRGPAWFKSLSYNKTVIIPEGALSPGSPEGAKQRIRSGPGGGPGGGPGKFPGDFKRKGIISEGAKPWICNWPETYLELFIYAGQNSSLASMKGPSGPPPGKGPKEPKEEDGPPPPKEGSPTSSSSTTTTTTTLPGWTDPSGPSKYPPGAANNPTWSGNYPEGPKPTDPAPTAPIPPSSTTEAPSSSSSGPYGPIDANDNFTPPPPAYPRVIKLEERHMHGRSNPTCTQVEIQDMGQPAKPVKGPDGKPIIVEVVESEPSSQETDPLSEGLGRRTSPLNYREVSGPPSSQCGCVWFLT
ncbi:hypothetical protein B0T14DRAFT_538789 [Immersiella caudata]|uniref:DUF7820 domain-containing protein n=1 Tax=Immersiella caudata TaxID=314043 RepID=A0AA39WKS8_9PEZI|nr:hypothetical protein B0T14DRAFT_538789 [Immersiella caudata]